MTTRTIRERYYPILELVLRCTKDRVWLSIESEKDDYTFMRLASSLMRKSEYNELFDSLCHEINKIYKIKENKNKIINLNKSLKKEDKFSILAMNLVREVRFNKEKMEFEHVVTSSVFLYFDLMYMQDERQFDRLVSMCYKECEEGGILDKLYDFLIELYSFTVDNGFNVFSVFDEEEIS